MEQNEIVTLKQQIGGLKSVNERHKRKIEELENRLKQEKAYAREADELNEQKVARIEELEKSSHVLSIDNMSKAKVIEGLENQVVELQKRIAKQKEMHDDAYQRLYDKYVCIFEKPWYKRLFLKM